MKLKKKIIEQESPKFTDLKQVMDYSRNFSIFYSGVEYDTYFEGCYDMGICNFLMSYHYLQTKHINFKEKFGGRDIHLFIDSGAHTYQNDPKYLELDVEYWEEHLQKYLSWVERNKDYIFGIASFDFENVVGPEKVDEWNKKYLEPFMLRTGIPVCFVWHQNSLHDWEYYCKRYPYIGFSSVNTEGESIDFNEYKEKLKVAEKHNALVHGFGMTRTSILPQLPFYTVDSTSWKSGFRYGQIAIWNGKKVQMFGKDDWNTKIFPVISSYPDIQLDTDKIFEYYEPEVLRCNVYAYIKAEEFICDRLKSLTYWKKARVTKVDLSNLPPDFFPTQDELSSHSFDVAKYAAKMNINPEYEEAQNLVHDATVFCNWDNPDYTKSVSWYNAPEQEDIIDDLHDTYINRIVPDKETKIQDLIKFFKECVSGENDKLLQLGTNFDRTVKERDSYVEDDEETELVDLTPEEVQVKLLSVIPDKLDSDEMPEVTELDKEIFSKANIVPTFDSRGKFVKGQVAVRKPKQIYSSKYPKLACDTCYAAQKCPEYKAGYVCAFHKMFKRFQTRNTADIMQAMQGMADFNLERMQRAMVLETLTGNFDPNVTNFINQNMSILRTLGDLYRATSNEVLKQTRTVRSDGTEECVTQVTNPQSGGILEKLFGNLNTSNSKDDPIEVDSEEVKPQTKNERYLKTDDDE